MHRDVYAEIIDYRHYFPNSNSEDGDIYIALVEARAMVYELTFCRISEPRYHTERIIRLFKRAICEQANYYLENGNVQGDGENCAEIASYSSSDISVTYKDKDAKARYCDENGISIKAYNTLKQTGLMNRRI